VSITCGLIALADMGTAMTLFITCFVIMFIGRIPLKQIFSVAGIGSAVLFLFLWAGQRLPTVISRVKDWWAMITQEEGHPILYQVEHGFVAISRGGFWGVGLGHSQERYFLPEAFSDYIYAIIIEEHGLKMGIVVIVLYLALLYRAMKATSQSDKAFGGLLSIGLGFSLVVQAIINMMVVVGLGPVTGLPLPFLSMGGTALLFSGISMGVLLSISRKDLHEPEIKNFNASKSDQKEE
jgi:cell division protein FtsW